jgi:glycosyltransferase involved in cell wall biosynthesis
MIGHGSAKARWQKLVERLGVAANIEWQPWLPRAELANFYVSHQVMLFPSLHDTGGMVVLESLAYGLPVVCLNIGGPGIIVTNDCGRVIDVAGKSKTEVVAKLGQALIDLTNEDMRLRLVAGAGLHQGKARVPLPRGRQSSAFALARASVLGDFVVPAAQKRENGPNWYRNLENVGLKLNGSDA